MGFVKVYFEKYAKITIQKFDVVLNTEEVRIKPIFKQAITLSPDELDFLTKFTPEELAVLHRCKSKLLDEQDALQKKINKRKNLSEPDDAFGDSIEEKRQKVFN